ncbi:hypothetical protein E8E11_009686 [Didymella keratinophila]|nr:hypothetical protein E8E11_009686 [Didymella keratinophila]
MSAKHTDLGSMNSSFLELPTELRLKIYKYALMLPVPSEFLPDSGSDRQTFCQRRHDEKFYRCLFNRNDISLGFLRACKQVNQEAAEGLYGQNEFRLYSTKGCILAAAFVFTMKARHTRWLTHLTIAMPLYSCDSSKYEHSNNPGSKGFFQDVLYGSRTGLDYPKDREKCWSHEGALALLVQRLRDALRLEELALFLRDYLELPWHNNGNLRS